MKKKVAKKIVFALLALDAAALFWKFAIPTSPPMLRVTFLDVGQGDAAVIESPGGKTILVDTGGVSHEGANDEGRRTVAPFLRSRGINRIDMILLSHPHTDHIGGAKTLLNLFPVGLLMDNGQDADKPPVADILTAAQSHSTAYRAARRGQIIELGDGAVLRVLAPTEAETHGTVNNGSMVLRLEYRQTNFLFTGDAEKDEENDLVTDKMPLACDALKVGHHGSDSSTTPEFLAEAHPHFAIVSVGKHNLYGHPRQDILQRLTESGAAAYRTDERGAVTCVSDGATVKVETMRGPSP